MRILLVIGSQVNGFPPVRNLLEILLRNEHTVTLLARDKTGLFLSANEKFQFIKIPEFDETNAMYGYIKKVRFMRNTVRNEMTHHDILWTATDSTVRDLGKLVLNYRHIMQLMELIQDIPRIPGQKKWGLGIKKYAQNAYKVVVPEYNRAHIQKTWWSLNELPSILPNKMTVPEININNLPEDIKMIIEKVKSETRKIILYQGVFYDDRDLEHFVEAVSNLRNEYVLYLMGAETDYKKKLCSMSNDVVNVPFIKPPFHLLVTQYAHIGLLPYKAGTYMHYDVLNGLYCAPNKIYEYAAYGVPMIGTDVPGLRGPFLEDGIGLICKPYSADTAIRNIIDIDNNYNLFSKIVKNFIRISIWIRLSKKFWEQILNNQYITLEMQIKRIMF